jgi:hypothetical protein
VTGFINEMSGLLETTADEDDPYSRIPSDDENTFELLRKRGVGKPRAATKSASTKKLAKSSGINLDFGRRKDLGYYSSNIYN